MKTINNSLSFASDNISAKTENEVPWIGKDRKIDEVAFCDMFLENLPLKYINGKFYSIDGEENTDKIKSEIATHITGYIKTDIEKLVAKIFGALKLRCFSLPILPNPEEINMKNGVLKVTGEFIPKKQFCVNRISIDFSPNFQKPTEFLKFLNDLLEETDIITLQEYLGYCLVPSTKAQKALFIIGTGGEGKSRIGVLLNEIFGSSMIMGNFQRIETDKFFRHNLLNKLLMIDDDLQMTALKTTGYIKSIITAEAPIDIEAKNEQSHSALIYSRFLCFGNGSPQTLYDKSEGFARRLLILSTKPRPLNRIDNPFLAEKLIEEKEKIFNWMFLGLQRLIENNYKFTISEKTKKNLENAVSENCNVVDFIGDKNFVLIGNGSVSSANLFEKYSDWCECNALIPLNKNAFVNWLNSHEEKIGIKHSTHIISEKGTNVRGFVGISIV